MSGLGDAFDKLKKAASENSEKVAEGVDKAKQVAKEKTGGKYDDKIDKAGSAATDYLRKQAKQDRERNRRSGEDDRP
ncbi:antitoxin [Nocardiopsis mangrovi]|uniref:Antitoxin n=1 Tax=Nocardiopsis mangrovi TaxID=1179818 RepID=A0ABV9DTU4_9ACTN